MDASLGKDIIVAAEATGRSLSDLGEIVRRIENAELRREILRSIVEMMIRIYEDVMRPVIKEHPDLDPDKK